MTKRYLVRLALLLVLLPALSPSGQAAAWTVRLERRPFTDLGIGFRELSEMEWDDGDSIWRLSAGGHRFVFKAPLDGATLSPTISISIDEGTTLIVQGSVSFRTSRETSLSVVIGSGIGRESTTSYKKIIAFPASIVSTGARRIILETSLEQEQAYTSEPLGLWLGEPPAELDGTIRTWSHPLWTLLVRNTESYHGILHISDKRDLRIWLVDADLDGEFGEFTQAEHGDILTWGAGSREQTPLAPEINLKGNYYRVGVVLDNGGGLNLTLTSGIKSLASKTNE